MEFPKLTDNLSIISALGDNPGADDGLSAEELKAKFDEAALILQRYLNGTLVERLNEIFSAGPGVPSDGFNMNGPINMNGQPLWNVRDPVGDGDALNLRFANATYVSKDRTINGKSLAKNISLNANDVDARPNTWLPTIAEIGAAPGGYGLGLDSGALPQYSTPAQVDALTKAGWYEYYSSTDACCGYLGTYYGGILVIPSMWDITQFFFCRDYYGGYLKRTKTGDVWQPWEWVNPPMDVGREYRTTERYNGKPVYAKLVNCGSGPNNTTKTIEHGVSNAMVIDFGGYMEYDGSMVSVPWQTVSSLCVNSTRIEIATTANYSTYTAYVWIKYYKTTD